MVFRYLAQRRLFVASRTCSSRTLVSEAVCIMPIPVIAAWKARWAVFKNWYMLVSKHSVEAYTQYSPRYLVKFLFHACFLVLRNMDEMSSLTFGYAPGDAVVIKNDFKNSRLSFSLNISVNLAVKWSIFTLSTEDDMQQPILYVFIAPFLSQMDR